MAMEIHNQNVWNCSPFQEAVSALDLNIASLLVECERMVSYLSKSKSQIFDSDLALRTVERKPLCILHGDFFFRLLMVDVQLIDEIRRTHHLHPAVELLIQKASERMLFGSPRSEWSMSNSEWLSWYDTMNGCIGAVRKHSNTAGFKKVQANFEVKATKDYISLKKKLNNQLRINGFLRDIRFDLIIPCTPHKLPELINNQFDHLQNCLLSLLRYISNLQTKSYKFAAWAISRKISGSYCIQVTTFFSLDHHQINVGDFIEHIKSAWKKISSIGSFYYQENPSNQGGYVEVFLFNHQDLLHNKEKIDEIAFSIVMPSAYRRLKVDGAREVWGIQI